jgi:hypothetical protein
MSQNQIIAVVAAVVILLAIVGWAVSRIDLLDNGTKFEPA